MTASVEVSIREAWIKLVTRNHDEWVTLTETKSIEFDPDDIENVGPEDLIAIYGNLGSRDQADFLKQLKEYQKENPVQVEAESLADEMEMEYLLSFRGKFSMEELKKRLESTDVVATPDLQGCCCPYCDMPLDLDDLVS